MSWARATAGTSSSRSAHTSSDRLAVAYVVGAKGLRGRVRVEPLSDRPERLAPGAELFLDGEATPRRVTAAERSQRGAVIELDGVTDRDAAEALVGRYLEVDAADLPPDTYYWHEIVGIDVRGEDGEPLGRVVEVFRAGENEVYRIAGPSGETLVPALRDTVLELDVERRRMVVRTDAEEVR